MQDAGTVLEVLRDRGRKGPEPRRERGTVTGEPSALKGARWVRREAARKRPAPIRVRDLAAQPTLLRNDSHRSVECVASLVDLGTHLVTW